jgi:hypothetical protein
MSQIQVRSHVSAKRLKWFGVEASKVDQRKLARCASWESLALMPVNFQATLLLHKLVGIGCLLRSRGR